MNACSLVRDFTITARDDDAFWSKQRSHVRDVFSIPNPAFWHLRRVNGELCAYVRLLKSYLGLCMPVWDLLINTGAFGIIAVKMLNNILLLSVLTVTSFPSKTDSRKTSKDICKNRCSCEEKENALNINCENKGFTTVSHFQPPQNKIRPTVSEWKPFSPR